MKFSMRSFFTLSLFTLLSFFQKANAQTAAIQSTNTPDQFFLNTQFRAGNNVGWSFTVGANPITLTALGLYDAGNDGLAEAHPVGIWTSAGILLSSTTIPAGTAATLNAGYRYNPITSIVLAAGQTYVIGTLYVNNSADQYILNSSQTIAPQITYGQSQQNVAQQDGSTPPFGFPSGFPGPHNQGYFGPNFQFTSSCDNDTEAPVPDVASLPNITGQCTASIISAPTATDNCLLGSITGTTPDPTSYSAQGTYTIHWTYSDGNGNTSTQDQAVIVKDVSAPVPDVATLPDITGQCMASIISAPTATDNCLLGSITGTTPDPTSYSAQGTYTIHWTYSDGNGNTSIQDQTVIIHDIIAPTITCPANITVNNAPNQCGAVVNYGATASDNCPGTIISYSPLPGSFFLIGETTVTATATDGAGNTTYCTFKVKVVDTQAPTITCLADVTVNNAPNQCGAVVNYSANASDNCPGVIVNYSPQSGSFFSLGTTTVTATATDQAGNTSYCTFKVTVVDAQAPTITCPANITVDGNSSGSATVSFIVTATDNCSTPAIVTKEGTTVILSPHTFPVGTHIIDATATDAAGNASTCTFTITVNSSCQITCPANIVVNNKTGFCGAYVNYPAVTATGSCGTVSYSMPSGSLFPIGTTTVTATSPTGSTCSFTVTVKDVQKPVIVCPANITVTAPSNACNKAVTFNLTATDNCPGVTVTSVPASGSVFSAGTTTVTVTAKDASNNITTSTFTVTVKETTPPVITCPASITVNAPANQCSATVNPGTATATDNCSAVTISGTRSDNKALNASYPLGVTTITWKAKDASGNSCTCLQTITVKDNQPPVITNVSVSPSVLWPADHSLKTVTVNYSGTDNCSYNSCQLSVTSNEPISGTGSGDLSPDWQLVDGHRVKLRAERKSNGTGRVYTITITCTDQAGNKTTKTATVTVPINAPSTGHRSETPDQQDKITGLTAQVVPNPANQVFNLVVKSGSNEEMEIRVFDIAGRVVQQMRTAATNVISFGDKLVQGTYIVELRQGDKRVVLKAVKQQ
jgi:HYR domain/Secretion system C-terminal sorting domain